MDSGPASIWTEFVLILLLIIANGVFAMSEIAIVSSRKARLERMADEGSSGARAALGLAKDPTPFLSSVQVGITLIGIVTGAYGGATLSKPLAEYLHAWSALSPYADTISMTLVVAIITYLSLIVGELVPKRIALNNPESLAVIIAIPMRLFSKATSPVVTILSTSTKLALQLLRIKQSDEPPVTEEEIKILIAEGTAYGTFEHAEKDLVERVFHFGDLRVSTLMTPRTQIDWLDLNRDDSYNMSVLNESTHSWLPVAKGSLDELVGIVKAREVFSKHCSTGQLGLNANTQEPLIVPEGMQSFRLLELFRQSGRHVAIVMDEFGGMAGLVTVHDILEQLVGDLPQEDEEDEPQIIQREDGSWLVDGLLPIEAFKERFGIEELSEEDSEQYHTLGGFVTTHLGTIPKASDTFEWKGLRIEIVDMDRARIDKLLISLLPSSPHTEKPISKK